MIKSVQLQNFKCIKEQTLSELTPIVCIVGKNGSGKSSLLQALVWVLKNDGGLNGGGIALGDIEEVVFGHDGNNTCACEVNLYDGRQAIQKIGKTTGRKSIGRVDTVRYFPPWRRVSRRSFFLLIKM